MTDDQKKQLETIFKHLVAEIESDHLTEIEMDSLKLKVEYKVKQKALPFAEAAQHDKGKSNLPAFASRCMNCDKLGCHPC